MRETLIEGIVKPLSIVLATVLAGWAAMFFVGTVLAGLLALGVSIGVGLWIQRDGYE